MENKKSNKLETVDQFMEKLLFDIFMDCVVVKDTNLFNFGTLRNIVNTDNFPIQTDLLVKSYKQDNGAQLGAIQNSNKYFFIMYMNYQNLYKLEYYDEINESWHILDENKLSKFTENKLLCRYTRFINDKLSISKDPNVQMFPLNQYFILDNT